MKINILNDGGYSFLSHMQFPFVANAGYTYRVGRNMVANISGFDMWEALKDAGADDNVCEYAIELDLDFIVGKECEVIKDDA